MAARRRLLWQALLALGLGLLAWRMTALGLATFQVSARDDPDAAAARQALDWYPRQAEALYRQGLALIATDGPAASAKLTAAFRYNPTDHRPLLGLARLALDEGDSARADQLITRVDALRPSHADLQRDLGDYWWQRQQPEQAFEHWSRAIAGQPTLAPGLFKTFRELLADPAMVGPFTALTQAPPTWWEAFFTDTAQRGTDLTTLRRLYRLRREAPEAPLSQVERQAYYERLLREGQIEEAYLAWVNSLTAAERQHLGLVFNGQFELPLSARGFDWRVIANDRAEISRAHYVGEDNRALRIRFKLLRTPFDHLAQTLFLAPGAHELSATSRSVDLLSEGGFRWQVRCLAPNQEPLGESQRLFGSDSWTTLRFEFAVPATCQAQELRLVSADGTGRDLLTDGELWLDAISIRPLAALSPLARGKLEATRAEEQAATPLPNELEAP